MKSQATKNSYKTYIWQRLTLRLYKELSQLDNKKTNNPAFKNTQMIWTDISSKKIYRWQISTWKHHWQLGNYNWNHKAIPPYGR